MIYQIITSQCPKFVCIEFEMILESGLRADNLGAFLDRFKTECVP